MAVSSQTRLCVVRPLRKVQRTRRILGIEWNIGLSIAVREQSGSLRSLTLTHRMQIAPYIVLYVGLALLFSALVLVLAHPPQPTKRKRKERIFPCGFFFFSFVFNELGPVDPPPPLMGGGRRPSESLLHLLNTRWNSSRGPRH